MKSKTDHKKLKTPVIPPGKKLLLFDGVCNLCNGFVQFVITRDTKGVFLFASLQSDTGQSFLQAFNLPTEELSTVVMIDNNKAYTQSDVPLKTAQGLGGLWSLAGIFWVIPKGIRNAIYDWVAQNRYRWFGKKDQCMLPRPEWKARFLG